MSLLYGQYLMDYAGVSTGRVAQGISNMVSDIVDKFLQDQELGKLTSVWEGFLARGASSGTLIGGGMGRDLAGLIQQGLAKNPGYPYMSDVFSEIYDEMDMINNALHAGVVGGVGSSFAQYIEGLMLTPALINAYKGGYYEAGVLPWIRRHWMSLYTPNEPDMHVGFQMLQRGGLNRTEWDQYLAKQGWAPAWFDKLYNTLIRTPGPEEAFSWFKRDIITKPTLEGWLKAAGIDDTDLPLWERGLYRQPSLGELTRISDFVELSSEYIGSTLRGAGYTDSDVNYMVPALMKRPNREEIRANTTQLIWMYRHGRMSSDELSSAFDELGLLPTEKALDIQVAELQYGQQLIDEGLTVVQNRVKAKDPAVQTVETIKNAIEALGINEETSNLIAEQYYYYYVYSPP